MSATNRFNHSWQNTRQPMVTAFYNLSRRDQLALSALAVFLLLFGFGFGGYLLHQKANASQKAYDNTLADVFWLRSQAGNIASNPSNSGQAVNGSKVDTVRQILAQSGINAQVMDNNGQIQVSFSHPQAGVVNNIFNQLTQQGLTITQLQINQPTPERLDIQAGLN